MPITLPDDIGWTTFDGGGSDPTLCGDGTTPEITVTGGAGGGASPSLSCTIDTYSLVMTITGGTPPFIWAATGGILTITDIRTATLAIHQLGTTIHFFKPVEQATAQDCSGFTPCVGTGEPIRTEVITQTLLRSLDCLGMDIGLGNITDPDGGLPGNHMVMTGYGIYTPTISDDLAADTQHYNTVSYGGTDIGTPGPTYPNDISEWVSYDYRCTEDGEKTVSTTAIADLAGKTGVNGTIHAAAAPFNETINWPINQGGCGVDGAYGTLSYIEYDGVLDVRTQEMIDAGGCCTVDSGNDIIVTVVDAEDNVVVLIIPVV